MSESLKAAVISMAFIALVAVGSIGVGDNMRVTVTQVGPLFARTLWVTAAYFVLYYFSLFRQSLCAQFLTKKLKASSKDGKVTIRDVKYGPMSYQNDVMYAMNRVVGNQVEQMTPFLFSLWACAIVVSDGVAAQLGAIYLIFRVAYLAVYNTRFLLLSTVPCYMAIGVMWVHILRAAPLQ
jgi:hypothetical protein